MAKSLILLYRSKIAQSYILSFLVGYTPLKVALPAGGVSLTAPVWRNLSANYWHEEMTPMTKPIPESLTLQLAQAITAEHEARTIGAWEMQQIYMRQICELRRLVVLEARDDYLRKAVEQVTKDWSAVLG